MARGNNCPTVVCRYFFADGQPNARTSKFVLAMQPLEHLEDAFGIFFFETQAVIDHIDAVINQAATLEGVHGGGNSCPPAAIRSGAPVT